MSARRHGMFALGLVALIVFLTAIPDAIYRAAQAMLLVVSGVLLVLFAGAIFFSPARQLLSRLFGYGARYDGPAMRLITEPEWRDLMQPLFTALVLLAAAIVPGIVRAI